MNAISNFLALDQQAKRRVHLRLCRYALEIWEDYVQHYAPIEYADSVVGMHHVVDTRLPHDAYASVGAGTDHAAIGERYLEPIVAMQDMDLEFPDHIEFAYYSIYNLFRKYVQNASIDDWLIVNQALSAHEDRSLVADLLRDALQNV